MTLLQKQEGHFVLKQLHHFLCRICVHTNHPKGRLIKQAANVKTHLRHYFIIPCSSVPCSSVQKDYPAKQYAHPFSCALPNAHKPEGARLMPGNMPDTKSFFTSAPSRFIFEAIV